MNIYIYINFIYIYIHFCVFFFFDAQYTKHRGNEIKYGGMFE